MEQGVALDEKVTEELDLMIGDLEAELPQADFEASPSTCANGVFCF